ncbi:hypothetical protein BAU07_26600 (plasmid) [Bordetella flabilis]|uniref:Uncharacterized protein n=2 Tax=Bordetella flabilis TaxID=463014 RepID=A0A193GN16_9BORD|nr:hypothetical protein BAU07_26600 [Bordetella flabilis]
MAQQDEAVWDGAAIRELDLDSQSVLSHFVAGASGGDAARTLNFLLGLDGVDRWAVDYREHTLSSEDSMLLRAFIGNLQHVMQEHAAVLDHLVDPLVTLLAGLTTSRCMLILRYLAQKNDRFIEQLASTLESTSRDDVMVSTVRHRLVVFERAQMLGRIFSGARLLRIMQIMGSYRDVV